jgi:hypothetical protein
MVSFKRCRPAEAHQIDARVGPCLDLVELPRAAHGLDPMTPLRQTIFAPDRVARVGGGEPDGVLPQLKAPEGRNLRLEPGYVAAVQGDGLFEGSMTTTDPDEAAKLGNLDEFASRLVWRCAGYSSSRSAL